MTNTNTPEYRFYFALLKHAAKEMVKRKAEYESECESYSEQGYRPHHCMHGTNMWTDYDNICGGCEDGFGWAEMAEALAWSTSRSFTERSTHVDFVIKGVGDSISKEAKTAMMDWVMEPLSWMK